MNSLLGHGGKRVEGGALQVVDLQYAISTFLPLPPFMNEYGNVLLQV